MQRVRLDRSLLVTIPCALAAGILCLSLPASAADGSVTVALAVCAAILITEFFPLHFAVRGERHTSTFVELPMVVGLVLAPGRTLALAVVGAIAIAQVARRLPLRKALFNVAQYALAAGAALTVTGPGMPRIVLAGLAFVLVNELAVQTVLRVVAGVPFGVPYRGRALLWLLHQSVSASGGLLIGEALKGRPGLSAALVPPLLFLAVGQREALRRTISEEVHRSIAAYALDQRQPDAMETLRLVSDLARDLLAAQSAEVLLIDSARPLLCVNNPEGHELSRLPGEWLTLRPWFDACLASGRTGAVAGASATIVLRGPDGPNALLAVFRAADQERFRQQDLATLDVLASTAEQWLSHQRKAPLELFRKPSVDVGLSRPQLMKLVQEIDLLSARIDGAPELDEMHALLVDSLTEAASARQEASVAIGAWVKPSYARLA